MRKYHGVTKFSYLLLILAAVWITTSVIAGGGDQEAAKKAWPMIESGALLVDVRSEAEFAAGHLEGAININWDETDELIAAIGANKERQVVFYCRSGNRAGKSINILEDKGYTNIFNATGLEALNATRPE